MKRERESERAKEAGCQSRERGGGGRSENEEKRGEEDVETKEEVSGSVCGFGALLWCATWLW